MEAGSSIAVWMLFILAGLLVGGTWSFYQQGNKPVTIVLGILALLSLSGALIVLFGAMP
ncbi:hypothetical protein [Corynebacterium sp. CCUG 70398]|uniref:hypothetical protein n=1 Tax=Corynebacterium sp. CCUG 70398 TaxID=2823891 RepID=UPI00210B296B|nr:hypothetical protein [Corynebacterium sp. CCUG 70398]MCQ4622781.1 hypothetical protein [Corynebacterium sp. CCUG 70398]